MYPTNELFIADGEWHVSVIDLEKSTATFTANADGDYAATHLRIDLFNFGKPQEGGDRAYVDLEFVALCEDSSALDLGDDDNVVFYNGAN